MIITPPKTESSVKDFPCCKAFFKCDDDAGINLRDEVSGDTITMTSGFFTRSGDAIALSIGTTSSATLPAAINPSTNDVLAFAVMDPVAGEFIATVAFSGAGSSTFACGSSSLVSDGVDSVSSIANTPAGSASSPHGVAVRVDISADTAQGFLITTNAGPNTYTASADTVIPNTWTPFTVTKFDLTAFAASDKIYGAALFVFTGGIPEDIKAALTWMTAEWARGNKVIYPGWKGLS